MMDELKKQMNEPSPAYQKLVAMMEDNDLNPRVLKRNLSTFVRSCREQFHESADVLIFYLRDEVRDVIGTEVEVDNVVYQIKTHASDDRLACMCDVVRDGEKVNSEYCNLRTERTALDAFADAVEGS